MAIQVQDHIFFQGPQKTQPASREHCEKIIFDLMFYRVPPSFNETIAIAALKLMFVAAALLAVSSRILFR